MENVNMHLERKKQKNTKKKLEQSASCNGVLLVTPAPAPSLAPAPTPAPAPGGAGGIRGFRVAPLRRDGGGSSARPSPGPEGLPHPPAHLQGLHRHHQRRTPSSIR